MNIDKFNNYLKSNKLFVSFYLIWILIHFSILKTRMQKWYSLDDRISRFWPFESTNLDYYDNSEFWVYMLSPLIFFIVWQLSGTEISKFTNLIINKIKYNKTNNYLTKENKENQVDLEKIRLKEIRESISSEKQNIKLLKERYSNSKYHNTLKKTKWFWIVFLTLLLGISAIQSISFSLLGHYLLEKENYLKAKTILQTWILIYMFIFAFTLMKNSTFLHKQSKFKYAYGLLWFFIGLINVWLLTIPSYIQNKKVKDKEIEFMLSTKEQA